MVLVDPKQDNVNIINFHADSPLSQRAAQRSGCVPEKMSKWDKQVEKEMKKFEEAFGDKRMFRLTRPDPERDNTVMAKTMQKILEDNTTQECEVVMEVAERLINETCLIKGTAKERREHWKKVQKKRKQEKEGWSGEAAPRVEGFL